MRRELSKSTRPVDGPDGDDGDDGGDDEGAGGDGLRTFQAADK